MTGECIDVEESVPLPGKSLTAILIDFVFLQM